MTFRDRLATGGPLLLDGAWGTQLIARGYPPTEGCPELLNVEHPDVLSAIAHDYLDAGAECIMTPTFGGNSITLSRYGLADRLTELNEAGVRISREAAGNTAFVLGSIASMGELLEPVGTVSERDAIDAFSGQIGAFASAGADAVLIETMSDTTEMRCAVAAARANCDLPVICSMTFARGIRGYASMMGVTPEAGLEAMLDAGADVVGSNCGGGSEDLIAVARIMRPLTDRPIWIKPNAGMPRLEHGETIYPESPEEMAARMPTLIDSGVNLVGGCCGTTPAHIAAFRAVLTA